MSENLDDCWLWTAAVSKSTGYGAFGLTHGHKIDAHRFVWIATFGPIPNGPGYHGTVVRHFKCNRRKCCNPHHLMLGSQSDNVQDAIRNGTHVLPAVQRGEKHVKARLTADLVREIRRRSKEGEVDQDIASDLNVHRTTVNDVKLGRTWKHVT